MDTANVIENRIFAEFRVGDSVTLSKMIRKEDIERYAAISGNANLEEFNAQSLLPARLILNLLGNLLPGSGTVYLSHELRFQRAIVVGDTVTATVTVHEKRVEEHVVIFDCSCVNQHREAVMIGAAEVMAPREKLRTSIREPVGSVSAATRKMIA